MGMSNRLVTKRRPMPECSPMRRPRLHSIVREFSTGATRDDEGTKPDYRGFLSPLALHRIGQYMNEHRTQADGTLRASDNWKKGIPRKEYLSSLLRHVVDYWRAVEGAIEAPLSEKELQDLLCAIHFNADGLLHERLLGRDAGIDSGANPMQKLSSLPGSLRDHVNSSDASVDMTPTPFKVWQKEHYPLCTPGCSICQDNYYYYFYRGPGPGVPK